MDKSGEIKTLRILDAALANPLEHQKKLQRMKMVVAITAWLGFLATFLMHFQGFQPLFAASSRTPTPSPANERCE